MKLLKKKTEESPAAAIGGNSECIPGRIFDGLSEEISGRVPVVVTG